MFFNQIHKKRDIFGTLLKRTIDKFSPGRVDKLPKNGYFKNIRGEEMEKKNLAESLWREHEPYIRKFCEYKLQSLPDYTDDCIQEVFLVLLKALEDGKEISFPKAYLTKIALNKINDIYKTEEKKRKTVVSLDDVNESTDFDFSLTEEISEEETEKHLEEILSTLTDSEKKLIEDFYIKKIRQKELAKQMNISENALRQQVFRLKRKIIKEIKKITT